MGVENSQLGKDTVYDHPYDPSLLFPIKREDSRSKLGIEENNLPFSGEDLWTCYELSWLEPGGKPKVAIADFRIPCDSPFIIESKSFKLYLNSLNHHCFESIADLKKCLETDLSKAAGAPIVVEIKTARDALNSPERMGSCIDDLSVHNLVYQPDSELLKLSEGSKRVEEKLFSELLRSNCPVTGQPDWGTVFIHYKGPAIDQESLLRYIISFRQCQDFHEHCVERIFSDLMSKCGCEELSVYARYTRRGGLDINPIRSTLALDTSAPDWRTSRQ